MCSKFLLLLLPFSLLFGTAQGQDFTELQLFKCFENSQLNHDSVRYRSYKITSGEYIVFEYSSDNAGDPGNHSKVDSRISFQVKKGTRKFEFKDEEIAKHTGVYLQNGHTQDRGVMVINKGSIKGKKLANGSWEIEFDVNVQGIWTGMDYHFAAAGVYNLVEN